MGPTPSPNWRAQRAFGLLALLLLAAHTAGQGMALAITGALPSWLLPLDLVVTLPMAYALMLRPRGLRAWRPLLAWLGVALGVARVVHVRNGAAVWGWLAVARRALLLAVAGGGAWRVARVVRTAWKEGATRRHDGGMPPRLAALVDGVAPLLGAPGSAVRRLVEAEVRAFAYAFTPARWWATRGGSGERRFGVARVGGNLSNQRGFLLLAAVELPIAHALIGLASRPAAWVVTVLSAYACVAMLASCRATRHRGVTVSARAIVVRHGLLPDLAFAPGDVVDLQRVPRGTPRPRRRAGELRRLGAGEASVCITFAASCPPPAGPGTAPVTRLHLAVDEPEAFIAAWHAARAAASA